MGREKSVYFLKAMGKSQKEKPILLMKDSPKPYKEKAVHFLRGRGNDPLKGKNGF